MTQKIIEVIGTSKESFAKAAEAAVQEAAKTVRGIKWATWIRSTCNWTEPRFCNIALLPGFISTSSTRNWLAEAGWQSWSAGFDARRPPASASRFFCIFVESSHIRNPILILETLASLVQKTYAKDMESS
jgi:hypothetical protein